MFSHVVERCVILTGAGRERRLEDLAHAGVVSLSGTDDGSFLVSAHRWCLRLLIRPFSTNLSGFSNHPPSSGRLRYSQECVMFSETLARPSEDPVSSTANQM